MKNNLLALFLFALVLVFAGCATPISSQLDVSESQALGLPAVSYNSEKDFLFKKTVNDSEGNALETVEIQAVASAPAYAQAQREAAMLETLKAAVEAIPSPSPVQ